MLKRQLLCAIQLYSVESMDKMNGNRRSIVFTRTVKVLRNIDFRNTTENATYQQSVFNQHFIMSKLIKLESIKHKMTFNLLYYIYIYYLI